MSFLTKVGSYLLSVACPGLGVCYGGGVWASHSIETYHGSDKKIDEKAVNRDESIFDNPTELAKMIDDKELTRLSKLSKVTLDKSKQSEIQERIKERINDIKESNPDFDRIVQNHMEAKKVEENEAKISKLVKDSKMQKLIQGDLDVIKANSSYFWDNNDQTSDLLKKRIEQFGPEYMAALELVQAEKGEHLRDIINANNAGFRISYDDRIYKYLDEGAKISPRVAALAMRGAMNGEGTYEETMNRVLFKTDPYFAKLAIEQFNEIEPKGFASWVDGDYDFGARKTMFNRIDEIRSVDVYATQ